MRLDIFNPWRDLTTWSGLTLQYQTSKRGDTWGTYIREKDSKQPITFGISRNSKEESLKRAEQNLKRIGIEGVQKAMATGQMIRPNESIPQSPERKDVDWRDGSNHRYRAQRDIVDGKPQQ
jgi:hypothetical protein